VDNAAAGEGESKRDEMERDGNGDGEREMERSARLSNCYRVIMLSARYLPGYLSLLKWWCPHHLSTLNISMCSSWPVELM
jgi:hypothetical protein